VVFHFRTQDGSSDWAIFAKLLTGFAVVCKMEMGKKKANRKSDKE
jgi:hypothetical protein